MHTKSFYRNNTISILSPKSLFLVTLFVSLTFSIHAQFVHPGISHKKSDLDRMKYMVAAQIEPYYKSYQNMVADSKSSYNYSVQGKSSFTELGRDSKVNYGAWNSDIRAAYYNAIRWYITGDHRHADKAVEIFKAWSNLKSVTSGGTEALSGGVGYIMIEAAEIIKNTYSGWSSSDIQKFGAMLVYPGYSSTRVPDNIENNSTFYWSAYQGDSGRHGNQGLSGWRTVMAMGIFLDNELMYDRALRYIKGQPHRSDDLPYPAGPRTHTNRTAIGDHADTYNTTTSSAIPDYGYNEVMTNYIYETGQCQESSRDQAHVLFGLGLLTSMAEMAWNQGDDLYSHENNRLLLGLEYSLRYNVSHVASYADQMDPWQPSSFLQGFDRTERWYSKSISPDGRGDFTKNRPNWEMAAAHYIGRGFKTESEAKWTLRARDKSIDIDGYERAGWTNDAIGWGGLTFRRPAGCYGDPINGFSSGLPNYNMNVVPGIIEAENYDYSTTNGQGRTYNDTSNENTGNQYRTNENVDIETRPGGGYAVGWIASGEWLTYTIYVPETATYDIAVNYAAANANGAIKFEFEGSDKTGVVTLPATGGTQTYADFIVKNEISLSKGVQHLKVLFSGTSNTIHLNNLTILEEGGIVPPPPPPDCELPWTASNFTVTDETVNYSSGIIDISCVDSLDINLDIQGEGKMEDEDYINVYYKVDGGSQKTIAENVNAFATKNLTIAAISGDSLELIIQAYTSYAGEVYTISNVTISESHSLGQDELLQQHTNIYPNPTTNILNIDFKNSEHAKAVILDVGGKTLLSKDISKGRNTINMQQLSKGFYIIKITSAEKILMERLVKN